MKQTGLLLILIILLVVHESNDRIRHNETKQILKPMSHDVDSIGDHGRYVIEHHFKYCKLTPNNDYKPFYPEID